jgi:hypothetical protein
MCGLGALSTIEVLEADFDDVDGAEFLCGRMLASRASRRTRLERDFLSGRGFSELDL